LKKRFNLGPWAAVVDDRVFASKLNEWVRYGGKFPEDILKMPRYIKSDVPLKVFTLRVPFEAEQNFEYAKNLLAHRPQSLEIWNEGDGSPLQLKFVTSEVDMAAITWRSLVPNIQIAPSEETEPKWVKETEKTPIFFDIIGVHALPYVMIKSIFGTFMNMAANAFKDFKVWFQIVFVESRPEMGALAEEAGGLYEQFGRDVQSHPELEVDLQLFTPGGPRGSSRVVEKGGSAMGTLAQTYDLFAEVARSFGQGGCAVAHFRGCFLGDHANASDFYVRLKAAVRSLSLVVGQRQKGDELDIAYYNLPQMIAHMRARAVPNPTIFLAQHNRFLSLRCSGFASDWGTGRPLIPVILCEPEAVGNFLHVFNDPGLPYDYTLTKITPIPPRILTKPPEIVLADVQVGPNQFKPFGISYNEIFEGIFIGGAMGTGKSTEGYNLINQIVKRGDTCVVYVDPKGQDTWEVLKFAPLDKTILLDLRINLQMNMFRLLPYNKDDPADREWMVSRKVNSVIHKLGLIAHFSEMQAPKTASILHIFLTYLYTRSDEPTLSDLAGLTNAYVRGEIKNLLSRIQITLGDESYATLRDALTTMTRYEKQSWDALSHRVNRIVIDPALCATLNVRGETDLRSLIKPGWLIILRVCYEDVGSQEIQRALLLSVLDEIWGITRYNKNIGTIVPTLLVVDEFASVADVDVWSEMVQMRTFKLAPCFLVQNLGQMPPKLNDIIVGNTRTKIAFSMPRDVDELSRILEGDSAKRREVAANISQLANYYCMVKTRANEGEQWYSLQAKSRPPPAAVNTSESIAQFLEKMKTLRTGTPAETLLKAASWERFVVVDYIPDEVQWRILCALYKAGKMLGISQICDRANLPRPQKGNTLVLDAINVLMRSEVDLVRIRTSRTVKPRMGTEEAETAKEHVLNFYELSQKGRDYFHSLTDFSRIGKEQAGTIAQVAFNYYISSSVGMFVSVAAQPVGEKLKPDMVGFDFTHQMIKSIEIESDREIETHANKVGFNLGTQKVGDTTDAWCSEEKESVMKEIINKSVDDVRKTKIRLFLACPDGKVRESSLT
jgi:hypothetical protein